MIDYKFNIKSMWDDYYQLWLADHKFNADAQDSILENEGKLFTLMALEDNVDKFYKTIAYNIPYVKGMIPRTKWNKHLTDHEIESNFWQPINNMWYRCDTSHSQAFYIIMGLKVLYDKTKDSKLKDLLDKFVQSIIVHDYKITYDGMTVPKVGTFFPSWTWVWFGVSEIRADCIRMIAGESFSFIKKIKTKLAYALLGTWAGILKPSDKNNMSHALWFAQYLDKNKRSIYEYWRDKDYNQKILKDLEVKYEINGDHNPDMVKDSLDYLCRKAYEQS